jgi:hypothetical protein
MRIWLYGNGSSGIFVAGNGTEKSLPPLFAVIDMMSLNLEEAVFSCIVERDIAPLYSAP